MLPLSLLRRTSKERGIYVKMLYISITQCCLVQMLTTIHCCCCFSWERAEHKDPHSPRLLSIESPLGLWAPYPQKSYVSESLCGSDQEPSRLSKPLVELNVWINAFSFFFFFSFEVKIWRWWQFVLFMWGFLYSYIFLWSTLSQVASEEWEWGSNKQ